MKALLVVFSLFHFSLSCFSQTIDSSILGGLKSQKPFLHGKGAALQLTLQLSTIHVKDEVFYFGLDLRNRSSLSYPVDLLRLYLTDNNQTRRSSMQELEIIPLYADSLKVVDPHTSIRFLFAVPKFTIPQAKSFVIEIFEANGGRDLTLTINNWQLFKARPVKLKG